MKDWKFDYFIKMPGVGGMIHVTQDEAFKRNKAGCDAYWAPQEFNVPGVRTKEGLKAIRCVCGDFDNISQQAFIARLTMIPTPSLIVKTRSGFHAYWALTKAIPASEEAISDYRTIVETRLVPLGADPNAKDVARVLRPPMTRYWSDSKGNVYLDREIYTEAVYSSPKTYSWEQLMAWFPFKRPTIGQGSTNERRQGCFFNPDISAPHKATKEVVGFWDKANSMDPKQALEVLSGTEWVNYETFSFKEQGNITRIHVNEEPSNAWIDEKNTIGSIVGAGPTIVNWLGFYHGEDNFKKIAEILKGLFPHLREESNEVQQMPVGKTGDNADDILGWF